MKEFTEKFISAFFQKNRTFKTILLYTLLPVIIVFVFSLLFIYLFSNQYVDMYKKQSINAINSVFYSTEAKMSTIPGTISTFSVDDEFVAAVSASNRPNTKERTDVIQSALNQIQNKNKYIHNILVYSKGNDTIIDLYSASTISEYFSQNRYTDYSEAYWYNYRYPISEYRFLPPTGLSVGDGTKIVVPLVFSRLDNSYFSSLIIVNIDFEMLLSDIDNSSDYTIGIVNKQTSKLYSKALPNGYTDIPENIYDITQKHNYYNGVQDIDGEKSLITYSSPSKSLVRYAYLSILPYSQINNEMMWVYLVIFLMVAIICSGAFFMAYFSSKKIYTPIEKLASNFSSKSKENSSNMIDYIDKSIHTLMSTHSELAEKHQNSLTQVQNLYLINLLNSNESNIDIQTNEYFSFEYEYFASIVYHIAPTESFYTTFNYEQCDALLDELSNNVRLNFEAKFNTILLPAEKSSYYLILNLPSAEAVEGIRDICKSLNDIFEVDKEYVTFSIFHGDVHEGLSGLKKSHHEALYFANKNIKPELQKPVINISASTKKNKYILDINTKSELTNYLISFKIEQAKALIDDIINNNIANNTPQSELSALYVQLISTIREVMDSKNIVYETEDRPSPSDISALLSMSLVELHDGISNLLTIFDEYTKTFLNRLNIVSITAYIEENFSSDISLETIAALFNTTPKYVSKLIKTKLGMNFIDYLANIRIKHACDLMSESNITVNELYKRVGYSSRNAFTNAFKKVTGMTPSEYRKNPTPPPKMT